MMISNEHLGGDNNCVQTNNERLGHASNIFCYEFQLVLLLHNKSDRCWMLSIFVQYKYLRKPLLMAESHSLRIRETSTQKPSFLANSSVPKNYVRLIFLEQSKCDTLVPKCTRGGSYIVPTHDPNALLLRWPGTTLIYY